jgi:hypothetical protein
MGAFMRTVLAIVIAFILSGTVFAERQDGFDYKRGKIEGDAVVAGKLAKIHFTGDAAEATYYQIKSEPEHESGCHHGEIRRLPGFVCTKEISDANKGKSVFQCYIEIDLNSGQIFDDGEMCAAQNVKTVNVKGRASISGQLATFQIIGDTARAMYQQMSGKNELDTGCTAGTTKRFSGFICTKNLHKGKASFECFVDINLKTGKVDADAGGMCPEEDFDAEMDAKGNKFQRLKTD